MLQITENLRIAIKASLLAGKAIMEVYDTEFSVDFKDDKSPLTEADQRANKVIHSYLVPTKIPIISEENKQTDFSERREWDQCWIVDPLDGTKEFIKRNGEFTVNIAMVKKGVPKLGVIYVPVEKTIYFADVAVGKAFKAQVNDHEEEIESIIERAEPIGPCSEKATRMSVVGSRSHMNQETLDYMEQLKNGGKDVDIVSRGSSLKFCLVAEGLADVYPRFAPTMEWDTAAGQAICNAVGLKVISNATNKPLEYNKENLLNPWFIVSK